MLRLPVSAAPLSGLTLLMSGRAGSGVAIKVRGPAMIPAQNLAVGVPAISMNGSAPHCEHLDGLAPVIPQSDHCRYCRDRADRWLSLAVCMSCGWVACSDDSPGR